jgi:hypothetical protein
LLARCPNGLIDGAERAFRLTQATLGVCKIGAESNDLLLGGGNVGEDERAVALQSSDVRLDGLG